MPNLTIKERKSKFNRLSNRLNIIQIKGYMVDYINKGKTLKQNLLI